MPPGAPESEHFTHPSVFLHVLGSEPDNDVAVFGPAASSTPELSPEASPIVVSPLASPYLLTLVTEGVRDELAVYAVRRSALGGATTPWRKIADPVDKITDVDLHGEDLYFLSSSDPKRTRLMRTSMARVDVAHATEVLSHPTAEVRSFAFGRDALYVRQLDAGRSRLERVPFDGGTASTLNLPFEGAIASMSANPTTPGALFQLTSWTVAPQLYRFDTTTQRSVDTGVLPATSIDFSGITSEEVEAEASDGTRVPLSIIRRKDLPNGVAAPARRDGCRRLRHRGAVAAER